MKPLTLFYLNRIEDETGISGTGLIARGLVLPSGKCVLEWVTAAKSICIYDNLEEVETIHGHGGKTQLIKLDVVESLDFIKRTALNTFVDDHAAFSVYDTAAYVGIFFGLPRGEKAHR